MKKNRCQYFFFFWLWLFTNFAFSAENAPNDALQMDKPKSLMEEINEKEADSDDRFFKEFANMMVVLGVVLAVILASSWFLKRMMNTKMQQANVGNPIKILERRAISQKASIYLVEILGKKIAIVESASGVTNLGEVSEQVLLKENQTDVPFNKIYDDKVRTES